MDENIACPACGASDFKYIDDGVTCRTCQEHFVIDGGIYKFAERDYFFGETSRPVMRQVLEAMRRDPQVIDALRNGEVVDGVEISAFLRNYVFSADRTSYIDYLLMNYSVPQPLTSLDIGSGYGLVGSDMERRGFHNYYVELTPERLEFAAFKNRHLGYHNGTYVCGGDRRLPVRSQSMSVITCIGVLEWVPSSITTQSPEEVQLDFLRQIHDRLRPDGYLVLGIENRFAYKYFLGYPDDHTGIRFITFLPRFLSDFYSRTIGRGKYRNFLYGHDGLKELILKAGFSEVDIVHPYPDYRIAKTTAKFADKLDIDRQLSSNTSQGFLKKIVDNALRIMSRIGLFRYFSYSFIAIAKK